MSDEDFELLEAEAARNGMKLEDFARRALNRSISAGTSEMVRSKNQGQVAVPSKGTRTDFGCKWLTNRIPPNFTGRDCSGTCSSPRDGFFGRPCHWSPGSARNCPSFDKKK